MKKHICLNPDCKEEALGVIGKIGKGFKENIPLCPICMMVCRRHIEQNNLKNMPEWIKRNKV